MAGPDKRPQARYRFVRAAVAGGDHQEVVIERGFSNVDSLLVGVDTRSRPVDKADTPRSKSPLQGEGDLLHCSLAQRHPGQRRDEDKMIVPGDDGDLAVTRWQDASQLVGRRESAK